MRDMIDGLLEYSRIESRGDPLQPVELDDVLADACDNLRVMVEESDVEIHADELPRVEGDEKQLRQLFQNLIDNAITYSGDEPPWIHVSACRDDTRWVVSVRDEGIGIDPDDADYIFEVFQRLDTSGETEGAGIGLALCQRIVERHGGEIWVESQPDEGATFSFTLPAVGESDE
jgi:signal transduction histidine kinase